MAHQPDYRDFERARVLIERGANWWTKPEGEMPEAIVSAARSIRDQQSYRSEDNLRHLRLYGNFDYAGLTPRSYSRSESGPKFNRISLNIVSALADTLTAEITMNRPKPFAITRGGDWKLQRRAKGLNKFHDGAFYEQKAHDQAQQMFRDGCILGTGVLHPYAEEGRLKLERVLCDELFVDDAEGMYGCPRQLFRVKRFPRDVALSLYGNTPERRGAIAKSKMPEEDGWNGLHNGIGDLIEIWEAWHLPSSEKAKDGRHIIAVDGCVLNEDVDWKRPCFPFVFFRYMPRPVGFWGQGLAERLTGIQLALNRTIREIEETMRLVSKGRIILPDGSKVPTAHINNSIGAIIKAAPGFEPKMWNANAVPPEQWQHLETLWRKAFEQEGVSQLAAMAMKPPGLSSGKALREHSDIQSKRFVAIGQAYERAMLDLAEMNTEIAKELAREGKGSFSVRVPGRRAIEEIDWREVDMERDAYVLQVFPVSALSGTPAAKREEVQEWIAQGWVDKATAIRLMDIPDLEHAGNLSVAALDDVDAAIERILDTQEPEPVDDFQDVGLIIQRGQAAYLNAKRDGAPDEALDALREWIDAAVRKTEEQQAKQAAQAQPAPMATPPMPQPGPVPTPGQAATLQ